VSSKQSNFVFGSNRNEPKLNLFRLFFGLFRETKQNFFRFDSVFRTGIETTETIKTNRKNLQKQISIRMSSKQFFFSVRTETNRTQPDLVVFRFVFWQKQTTFFSVCFGVSDQYRNNRNKQNLWYGEIKMFIF
jgi:hypothetical protein